MDFVQRWSEKTEIGAGPLIEWLDITASKFYDWRERYGKANEYNGWAPRHFWLEDWENSSKWLFSFCHRSRKMRSMERPKIIGGNTTVFISNMDEAIRFYTEVLGLKLTFRFRDHWATVEAGPGLTIGLHEARPIHPAPGTKGAMLLGLIIDEPIEGVVDRLSKKAVRFTEIVRDEYAGNFVSFEDPDGNPICLHEPCGEDKEETKAAETGSARA